MDTYDAQAHWWVSDSGADLPEEQRSKARAQSLIGCARHLETVQQAVHEQNLMNAQLFSNRELAAFDWGTGALHRASLSPINRTGENLVLNTVETLVAQVGKQRVKAKPIGRGASWRLRRRARLLDKALWGEFHRTKFYAKSVQVFRDACVFQAGGLLHVYTEDGPDGNPRLCAERVFPDEILVDQMEVVACGRPRHFYRRRALPAEVVAATWGVDEEELAAVAMVDDYLEYRAKGKGWVIVVEGWQLAHRGNPGRYMAAHSGGVLKEYDWPDEEPPFVRFPYFPFDGFYGSTAVEQALPYQIRLNEINEVIRDAQDIMARPRLLVAEGSRVNPYELDNLVAKIIKYTGIKPEPANWQAASAELYNERDRCWAQCREQFGLSNLASTGALPQAARYDSSAAFQEADAIQDNRLVDLSQRFQQFTIDFAEAIVRTLRRDKVHPKTVWFSGGARSRMEVIDWAEIDLDRDAYVLQLEPASAMSMTAAAQRDNLEKQLAMGLITPEQYRLELAHPDDSSELSLMAAAAADIRRVIELLEEGDYENPTPVQDLINGVQEVSLAYLNLSQYEDDDEDHPLDAIRANFLDWILEARNILDAGAEEGETPPEEPLPSVTSPLPAAALGPAGVPPAMGPAAVPVPESAAGHVQ